MFLLSLLLAPAAVALPPAAHVNGRWIAEDPPEAIDAEIQAAIDETVEEMNILIRGFARSKIELGTDSCLRYELTLDDGHLIVRCDEKEPFVRPLTTDAIPAEDERGIEVQNRLTLYDDGFAMRWGTPQGSRVNRFRFHDADSFTLSVAIVSPRLPQPVEWETRYRRVR